MAISIGDIAPDLTLKDTDGNDVTLSSFRGDKAVALVFYPFTFTGVCEGELCALRDDVGEFEAKGVQVLAISCDSRFAQKQWADEKGWTFPVLSDFWPHGEAARAYGVFDEEKGCAIRATFLVGLDGAVVDTFSTDSLGTPREKARYEQALAAL